MPDNRARISTNNRVKTRLGTVVHGKAGKRRAIFPASVNNALTRAKQAPRKMVARARESHTWAEIVRTRPRIHAAVPRESLIHAWPARPRALHDYVTHVCVCTRDRQSELIASYRERGRETGQLWATQHL